MNSDSLKIKVKEILTSMGYTNITFSNEEKDLIVVSFDSEELTSFNTDLPGWSYSGIQLNVSGGGRYKIEFKKSS